MSGGVYSFPNFFTAQLSDGAGSFQNPVDIGTLPIPWSVSGAVQATIPITTSTGLYKVRVIASNPQDTGSVGPNDVLVLNTAVLAAISGGDDTICNGDSVVLTVLVPAEFYSWSTGETTQSITVSQTGSYTVTRTDFLTGCQSTSEPYVVTVENCVGMKELSYQPHITIFPNPCRDVLHITYDGAANISVRNLFGQYVIARRSFQRDIILNLSDLDAGLYFTEVQVQNRTFTKKFVC